MTYIITGLALVADTLTALIWVELRKSTATTTTKGISSVNAEDKLLTPEVPADPLTSPVAMLLRKKMRA